MDTLALSPTVHASFSQIGAVGFVSRVRSGVRSFLGATCVEWCGCDISLGIASPFRHGPKFNVRSTTLHMDKALITG
jgi:hypothetical protein